MRVVKEDLYRLDHLVRFLNSKGYQYDFDYLYEGGDFTGHAISEMLHDIAGDIVFEFTGIAKVTLFDPNEENQQNSTFSFSMPVSGWFRDLDEDLLFSKNQKHFKSFQPYQDLSLGFFHFIDQFDKTISSRKGFPWLTGRNYGNLEIIYSLNLEDIPVLLDNVKFRVNKSFIVQKEASCSDIDSAKFFEERKQLKSELNKAQERLEKLETEQKEKPLEIQTSQEKSKLASTRAENGVAKLLLVLADMAKINVDKPYAVYDSLQKHADMLGIDKFPSDETVKNWLNKASKHKDT